MIKRLVVKNLYGQFDYDLTFQPDVNILTGKNGSGKTTLLKLIWYAVSGNVGKILEEEIMFENVFIQVANKTDNDKIDIEITLHYVNKQDTFIEAHYVVYDHITMKSSTIVTQIMPAKEITKNGGQIITLQSLFFPTFRRIEGGYGINNSSLNDSFQYFADMLNKYQANTYAHSFIFAISVTDVIALIRSVYADIAKTVNDIDTKQSNYILSLTENATDTQKDLVALIQQKVREGKAEKERLFSPVTLLSEVLAKVFENKGIRITEHITMGKESPVISPDKLSSGEKQMLSFLAYNAFYQHTLFLIDEPELSLHTDWQRLLVPTLLRQTNTNQFFLATHSSAIAAAYPDKEIWLDNLNQKGGN